MIVLPKQVFLPAANKAFDAAGRPTDLHAARRRGELAGELLARPARLAK